MTTQVWVASFSPAGDEGGVGGFYWTLEQRQAEELYDQYVRESKDDGGLHVVRLVQIGVESDPQRDAQDVTDELDSRIEEIESTAVALRQYVPEDAVHVPPGGSRQATH
ncbi:hypothetical protein [Gordonia sihwensis]|uniref:hypothetical protein n=1 Tax=Gordonia sihwensis TaxID=173559 RepID=UPI003D99DD47